MSQFPVNGGPPPTSPSQTNVNPFSKSASSSQYQNTASNYSQPYGGLSNTPPYPVDSTTPQQAPFASYPTPSNSTPTSTFTPTSATAYTQPTTSATPTSSVPTPTPTPPVQYTPLQSIHSGSGSTSGSSATAAKANAPRINPKQIPSPVNTDVNKLSKFSTSTNQPPPSVLSPFIALDDGNCTPRFIRMTLYSVPTTADLLSNSHIPLAAVMQPLAEPSVGELPIPVVDMGPAGPIRCQRCKAYINSLAIFIDGGRSYSCKFCDYVNEVPKDYYSPIEGSGRRFDHYQRPELHRGSVEFVATQEYNINKQTPQPLTYLFALDVSYNSIANGTLQMCVNSIKQILSELPETTPMKFGVITYDTSVHFYNLNKSLQQSQMMVVSDVNNVFVPLDEQVIFVKYKESKHVIDSLLEKIPSMFGRTKTSESALTAALQAGYQALKASGGRIIAFQSTLCTHGPGKLVKRDDPKAVGTDKEKSLYVPQESTIYNTLAVDCVKAGVCVDMFLFPSSYVDVATLSTVTRTTGGQIYYYSNFKPAKELDKFHNDLVRNLTRVTGYDALLKVRCSRGITIVNQIGNFHAGPQNEIEFAGIDADKSFVVQFKHDDKLDIKSEPCIQCALLYTTSSGERRIRVHNIQLNCADTLANIFRSADIDALMNFLTKTSVTNFDKSSGLTAHAARTLLNDQTTEMLFTYRKHCASQSSPGQLILPESLKLLPIFALGFTKSTALRPGVDLSTDDRAAVFSSLLALPVSLSTPFVYPRMFALHSLSPEHGVPDANGYIKLPPSERLSGESLLPQGAYLLENGQHMYLWLGRALSPEFVQSVFNVNATVDQLPTSELILYPFENDTASRIYAIVSEINRQRNTSQRIFIVKQGDPLELRFYNYLVDDKSADGQSYVDHLCQIHKNIQTKL